MAPGKKWNHLLSMGGKRIKVRGKPDRFKGNGRTVTRNSGREHVACREMPDRRMHNGIDEGNAMNQSRNISVKASVLETLQPHLAVSTDGNRYHLSHAVWQLARMGTYNEAGELPFAIRLEATDDFTELYENKDRLVCPVDTSDPDLTASDALVDALVKCAVFLARSRRRDMVDFSILVSAKAAEDKPEKLSEWDGLDALKERWAARMNAMESTRLLRNDADITELINGVLERTTVRHIRRRQGRLGEETLWGRELDAVKVLEDAGIDGSDLANALANLAFHVSGQYVERKKTGIVFDRRDATLMIRDYQRRARIQRPGVRVIDAMFLKQDTPDTQIAPRHPGWSTCTGDRMIARDAFDAALRWARLAALKSGRGLLPLFYLTGIDGAGRSVLLKQLAWELYREGFAVAEIMDLNAAADQAEALATAAVSLDAPLILVWDDIRGPGLDPMHAFREFADAQLSGVPLMILAAAPDVGYNPRKIRQVSRTSFEEFEVHAPTDAERERLGTPGNGVKAPEETAEPVADTAADTVEGADGADAVDAAIAEPAQGDPANAEPAQAEPADAGTEASEGADIGEVTVPLEHLQDQKTEEIMVAVTVEEDQPESPFLDAVLEIRHDRTPAALAREMNEAAQKALGTAAVPVFDLIRCMGLFGLAVTEPLAVAVCGGKAVAAARKGMETCGETVCRERILDGDVSWDCG
ncbi:MAG TPA: hypothetical protein PLV45_15655, partial [bacterium]|nr:hypothetical protein [bacterium]